MTLKSHVESLNVCEALVESLLVGLQTLPSPHSFGFATPHISRFPIHTSSNYFISPRQHIRRNRQTDLLRGFQVDDQLKLRSVARQARSAGLGSLQDLLHVSYLASRFCSIILFSDSDY